jgi:hypothetical protein
LIGAGLLASAVLAGTFGVSAVSAQDSRGATAYTAALTALPNTNGRGTASLLLSGDQRTLTVKIEASGLDAGVHLSHIHGRSASGQPVDSTCPTIVQDSDGDGFVELAEGAVTYGPILVDFMNIDPDEDGTIQFSKTFKLTGNEGILPLTDRHIVVHGMNVGAIGAGTPGEVNGTAEYKVLLPVLCGEITRAASPGEAMRFREKPRKNN